MSDCSLSTFERKGGATIYVKLDNGVPRLVTASSVPQRQISSLLTRHPTSRIVFNLKVSRIRGTRVLVQEFTKMITDMQLAVFCNILGVTLFCLVFLFHYINANYSK
ncbi:hypothetical protein KM043_000522 [Ampulex compressa]|nr:hypothetical protein KM043_000522 [Ampulex compressa]